VIEEMVWLSGVFQQEIKMKKAASKKCARMVQKHFTDKALVKYRIIIYYTGFFTSLALKVS
jgi:E1A-binding protein p400